MALRTMKHRQRAAALEAQVVPIGDTEFLEVTPDKAKEMLRFNKSNRDLHDDRVAAYAAIMTEGEWADFHTDPIVFDTNGNLLNGQHRLRALIRAQKTITFRVTRNVDPSMAHIIDVGLVRTLRDSMTINEHESIPAKSSSMFKRYLCGMYCNQQDLFYKPLEIAQLYHKYRKEVDEVNTVVFNSNKKGISKAGVRAAVTRAWVSQPTEREKIAKFVAILYNGLDESCNIGTEYIAQALREYLGKAKPNSKRDLDDYARTEWCLAKYLKGDGARNTSTATRELFPIEEDKLFL